MDEIRYTLIADGPSDRALLPILNWALREKGDIKKIQTEWADLRHLPRPPKSLYKRILTAIDLFPCDLLFIHRDAERQSPEKRYSEIHEAMKTAASLGMKTPAVCVVPVQMTEAWLLFDEAAIRRAAGNPNGETPLVIPELSEIERIQNPKEVLINILKGASGLRGRRLKKFNLSEARIRIIELISDFSPLRGLTAFQKLENNILTLKKNDWALKIDLNG